MLTQRRDISVGTKGFCQIKQVRRSVPGRGHSKGKGPEVGKSVGFGRNSENVSGAGGEEGSLEGDEMGSLEGLGHTVCRAWHRLIPRALKATVGFGTGRYSIAFMT